MGLRGIGATPLAKRYREFETGAEADRINEQANPWDAEGLSRAEKVIRFVEDLSCTSGALAFTKLELRPWQRRFVQDVYATDKHGTRRVRTAVLSMGRKNGKTQLAAALALCHLCGPEAENRGEVYSCANDRFQAGKIFDEMVAMISAHPWLSLRTNIGRFKKQIEDLRTGSMYVALTAEAKTKMGTQSEFRRL